MAENWTEITADWKGNMAFLGETATGEMIPMGTYEEKKRASPMQLLLVAIAGCTGMDIVSILQKKRLNLANLQVRVRGKRATEYPMIWTDIHLTYLIWGEDITPKDVEQAIQLSEDKYCSVGLMLGKAAKITSEYRILKPGEIAN